MAVFSFHHLFFASLVVTTSHAFSPVSFTKRQLNTPLQLGATDRYLESLGIAKNYNPTENYLDSLSSNSLWSNDYTSNIFEQAAVYTNSNSDPIAASDVSLFQQQSVIDYGFVVADGEVASTTLDVADTVLNQSPPLASNPLEDLSAVSQPSNELLASLQDSPVASSSSPIVNNIMTVNSQEPFSATETTDSVVSALGDMLEKQTTEWDTTLLSTTSNKKEALLSSVNKVWTDLLTSLHDTNVALTSSVDGTLKKATESPFHSITHQPISELLQSVMSGLGKIAHSFWTLITWLVSTLGGGKHVSDLTTAAQTSVQSVIADATTTLTHSLHSLGQMTLQEAALKFAAILVQAVKFLFLVVSAVVQSLSGRGMDDWLLASQSALQHAGTSVLASMGDTLTHVGQLSVAEITALLAGYVATVGTIVTSTPTSKAMAQAMSENSNVWVDTFDPATMDTLVERVSNAVSTAMVSGAI